MKQLLCLLLLLVAVNGYAVVNVRIYALDQSVETTYQSEYANLGDHTWSYSALDFNTYGPEFSNGGGTSNPDLRNYITGNTFLDGWDYVFTIVSDGNGQFDIALESQTDTNPPPPDPTLWDWWVAGWNMALGFCGFGLLLRVVKGLRGPGSGEI